jgi:hypothetical protein
LTTKGDSMLFRRQSRRERVAASARRLLPSRRTVAKTAGVAGFVAGLTAVSSGLSSLRQKQA